MSQINWEHLVGKTEEEATAQILKDLPGAKILAAPPMLMVDKVARDVIILRLD